MLSIKALQSTKGGLDRWWQAIRRSGSSYEYNDDTYKSRFHLLSFLYWICGLCGSYPAFQKGWAGKRDASMAYLLMS